MAMQDALGSWPQGPGGMAARVRAHDWVGTELGPVETWPDRLRLMVEQVLATPLVSTLVCGSGRLLIFNDAAAEFYGERRSGALGRPLPEVFPEGWAAVVPLYERAFAGEAVEVTALPLDLRGEGDPQAATFDATLVPVRDAAGGVFAVHMTGREVGARHRAEAALRDNEARQAFMLRLSDALRPLADPREVQEVAARVLGRHLGASRVAYAEDRGDGKTVTLARNYTDGVPGIEGVYRYADYGEALIRDMRAGRPVIRPDIANDPGLSEAERQAHAVLQLGATLNVPLVKDGRLAAILAVHHAGAHSYTPEEVALTRDVAERTWEAVERARAEAALRQSEARYRAFVTASSDVVYRMSPDWSEMRELDGRSFLADTASPRQGWLQEYILPEDWPTVQATIAEAIRARSLFDLEHRVRQADGSVGWTHSRAVPILDGTGAITEWLGAARDVTGRRAAELALAASEQRFRSLFQSMDEGYLLADVILEGERAVDIDYVDANPAAIRMVRVDLTGRRLREVSPDYEPYWYEIWGRVACTGVGERLERYAAPEARWYDFYVFKPQPENHESRRVAVVFQDITERKRAEAALRESLEHQHVLLAELQHRVRNTLGVVRSLVRRTRVGSADLDEFTDTLSSRLGAFARVQSMITRSADTGVDLGELVAEELAAHGAREGERARVEGPEVRLRGRAADTTGLVVHELATNAVKHGALATNAGRIDVAWTIAPGQDGTEGSRLHLVWQESGAAIAAMAPRRQGFGSELMGRQLRYELDAVSEVAYAPGGITCTIDVPLRRLTEAST